MGISLSLLVLGISLCLTALAAANPQFVDTGADFPLPLDRYHDQGIPSLVGKLAGRIEKEPLNLVATVIFLAAIAHTFLVAKFRRISYHYQQAYQAIEYLLHEPQSSPGPETDHEKLIFRAQFFHFMGEVEAVFGIWLVPLFAAIVVFHGWSTMVEYVGNVNVSDAIFVVVIMAIAGGVSASPRGATRRAKHSGFLASQSSHCNGAWSID